MDDAALALAAARAGAEEVRARFGGTLLTEFKGEVDPVTDADRRSEAAVLSVLGEHRPTDAILAEESGGDAPGRRRTWVVDPLDGTVNYLHGVPHVAVSVALWEDGSAQVGAIIDVFRSEEFTARAGEGALLNGLPIRVSGEADLNQTLVATGFPYDRRVRAAAYAHTLAAVLERVQGVRRMGTACLDLAWVAAGRYDAFWEFGLAPWDIAAGLLIVRQAGGKVTHHTGRPAGLYDRSLVASNGAVHERLLEVVAGHLPHHLRTTSTVTAQ